MRQLAKNFNESRLSVSDRLVNLFSTLNSRVLSVRGSVRGWYLASGFDLSAIKQLFCSPNQFSPAHLHLHLFNVSSLSSRAPLSSFYQTPVFFIFISFVTVPKQQQQQQRNKQSKHFKSIAQLGFMFKMQMWLADCCRGDFGDWWRWLSIFLLIWKIFLFFFN